ncbi:MAG: DUF362 domain-containing protein [Bacteroidales bacterium]|nr:MAG: DUF362 domain-containing protein [Bacteroidales bacterium]
MKRREFFRKSVGAGLVTGAALSLGGYKKIWAATPVSSEQFDLVAVRGGEPGVMLDRGIRQLGGMSTFVKPGQTVVVKPNIGWDALPERAANTNPLMVQEIVKQCLNAGARQVYVFDNTIDEMTRCYRNSGIEKAVKDAGGKMVPANTEGYYSEVKIPGGKRLQSAKVHELILESDVFINVPVLKNHSSTRLSLAMKNLMGVVWDRRYWHSNDLNQCIADYATYEKKPHLNIVDAYNALMRNGPRGVSKSDVTNMKALLISTNLVTIDAAAARMFGMEPATVSFIRKADEMGVGSTNLENIKISRINI